MSLQRTMRGLFGSDFHFLQLLPNKFHTTKLVLH
jgi:hypothetical protein